MSKNDHGRLGGFRLPTSLGLLAATAAIVALAIAPASLGARSNGADYLLPNGDIYQLARGSYHLIPDTATANAMRIQWSMLHRVNTVTPIGDPITSVIAKPKPAPQVTKTVAPVTKANGKDYILPNRSVYQLMGKTYRLIPDLATANAMGLKWNKLIRRSGVGPIGKPLPSVIVKVMPTCTTKVAATTKANGRDYILPNADVYQLSGGMYHLVPDVATANAMGLRWDQLHPAKSVGPVGSMIPSVCR